MRIEKTAYNFHRQVLPHLINMSPYSCVHDPRGKSRWLEVWQHQSAAVRAFLRSDDRQGALANGPQVGPHPGNRELGKGQKCRPVQIRKSPRGWPHQEAWGLTKVSILIPFIGGESSRNSQTVGRGGLWVKLSDGGLNA